MSQTLTVKRGRPAHPLVPGQETRTLNRRANWLDYYYRSPDLTTWAKAARQNSRRRARVHGVVHDLTAAQIAAMMPSDGLCAILGIPLDITKRKGVATANSATIDRIDNTQGYTVANCQVVSQLCNRGKSALNMQQLIKLGQWAMKQHNK